MIALLIRVVFFGIVIAVIYGVAKLVSRPSDTVKCSRCEGRGFWYDARGKEKCDWCKGSGRLPRQMR
jgi:DnaJ-class molecular chaperone